MRGAKKSPPLGICSPRIAVEWNNRNETERISLLHLMVSHSLMADELPAYLREIQWRGIGKRGWRCQHGLSQGRFDKDNNLLAKMSTYIPPTEDEFVQALRGHFRWAPSAGPSCFLSILNNERHGLAWGRQRYWDANCEEVRVYEIDLTQLEGHVVLRVNDLRERYGLELDWDTSDEYLVLNRIPARALVRETNIGDLIDRGK